MSVSCECCVLSGRGLLRRADHPLRGVLPSVVCRIVIEEPHREGISQIGVSSPETEGKKLLSIADLYAPLEGTLEFFHSEMNNNL